ncbi:hypothetical protein [Halomonas stenophila]|uniref:Uncharacterized protein n=1 Tax=Halomonas stenophila TaxID=795312 RepID=A0A7W5EV54_9GAMM|nr:hypothetical protein [Halomonas stenophila]MBB3231953.1 hypothetical protein [Halomonas stenophila]
MARRRYRRRRNSSAAKNVVAVFIILLSVSILGAFGWFWFKNSNKPAIDTVSLCPEDGANSHLAILIDTTDPITLTQLQAARQHIDNRIANAEVGGRVSFSTVSPDKQIRERAYYSICKPPSGDDASYFTENPKLIQLQYKENFLDPVEHSLNRLLTIEEAESSPIMEALQEFVTRIPSFTLTSTPREIVIMSDLVQHNEFFSFYRGHNWETFKNKNGPSKLSRNLNGVKLTILRVPRDNVKIEEVDDFWVRYFDAQGFNNVNVITIGEL